MSLSCSVSEIGVLPIFAPKSCFSIPHPYPHRISGWFFGAARCCFAVR